MVLYSGDSTQFGSASDPFVGKSLGGVITFGGGLALYDGKGVVGGALKASPNRAPPAAARRRKGSLSRAQNR